MIDGEELLEQYRAGEISGRAVKQALQITHGQFQKMLAERGIEYRGKPEPKFDMEHFHKLAERVERGELKKSEASAALGITSAYFGQMMQKHGYKWRKIKKRPQCEVKGGGGGTGLRGLRGIFLRVDAAEQAGARVEREENPAE